MAGATIAMGPWSRPGGGGGGGETIDPLHMMNEAMSLRNTQMEFSARQRAGSIIANNPDPTQAAAALQADPLVGGYYPEAINLQRQMQLTQAQTQLEQTRTQGELSGQARDAYADVIQGSAGAINDPSQLVPSVMERLSKYPVALQQRMMPSLELYLTSINHGLNLDQNSPTYQQDFNRYQARMFGKFVSIGKPEMVYQAMGLAPPTLEPKIPIPGGGTQPGYLGGAPWLYGGGASGAAPAGGPTQVAGPGVGGGATATDPPPGTFEPAMPGLRTAGPATFSDQENAQWQHLGDWQKSLNDQVRVGAGLQQNINQAEQLMKQFTPGPTLEWRTRAAALAKDFDADPATVKLIAGGNNIAAVQEFGKLVYNQVMNQINNSLPPGSRLNLAEYRDTILANPNPTMQAAAIRGVFNYWQRTFARSLMEQRELAPYMEQNKRVGGAAAAWDPHWQSVLQRKGLLGPDYKTMDGKQGIPPGDVLKLLGNDDPASRAAFDGKYGKGAAARFLDED